MFPKRGYIDGVDDLITQTTANQVLGYFHQPLPQKTTGEHRMPCVFSDACNDSISGHAANIEVDIAEAMKKYAIKADWTAESLALYTQATIQGAFILAKAKNGPEIAADCIDHLRRYIELLFNRHKQEE